MLQSKSVQVSDYDEMTQAISDITQTVGQEHDLNARFYFPHQHRWWEYASALTALFEQFETDGRLLKVLDVGAGHSVLGPTIALNYYSEVTEIEICPKVLKARKKIKLKDFSCIEKSILDLNESDGQFDAVFCISVIEHIPEWRIALQRLINRVVPGGLLVITTDYGDETKSKWVNDSERENKFVETDLKEIVEILEDGQFKVKTPDYTFHKPQVFDYTFFRVIAEKSK